jgi:hypothetical protein
VIGHLLSDAVLPERTAAECPLWLTTEDRHRLDEFAKCAKCHRFYDPKVYSETDWQTWMKKMNQKSKLKTDQAELLKRYLDEYRAGRITGKPEAKP